MALHITIIGLPNVGKSTAFNALTKEKNAEAANYAFGTIEPNKAIVTVPDERVDKLIELVQPKKIVYATIEFVDIAGLVEGSSRGEGLGNKFLGHIRDTAALVHVVRCFDDENIVHAYEGCDPERDVGVIEMELIMADLEQIERKIERLSKQSKGDKALQPVVEFAEKLQTYLGEGNSAGSFPERDSELFRELNSEMQFLSAKPVIFAANVDEAGLAEDNEYVRSLKQVAADRDAEVVTICAKVEEEMAGLSEEDRAEFLASMGAEESGLDQVIRKGYHALGLISFLTAGPTEVHAWTIRRGATAVEAAGEIHSDIQRGFIRAEVIPYETYVQHGSETAVKAAGDMSVEGKDYVVQDGDVVYFRFNV